MKIACRLLWSLLGAALMVASPVTDERIAGGQQGENDRSRYITVRDPHIALTNVRIIDGTGAATRTNQTLVISNGVIQQIGDAGTLKVPDQARIIDLSGRTVLPGLVMLHEHLHYAGPSQTFSAPRLYLAFGVTTIRTAGTFYPYQELNLKRGIDAGMFPGPTMFVTSPYIGSDLFPNGQGGYAFGDYLVRTPEDARRGVRYWAAEGVTSIKVVQTVTKEVLAAIIDEAHKLGLPVTAHLQSLTCRDAAELGIDNLEHGFGPCTRQGEVESDPNSPRAQALIRRLVDLGVVLTVTPNGRRGLLTDRERDVLHPTALEAYVARPGAAQKPSTAGPGLHPLVVPFVKAGGRIVLGSDPYGAGIIPGFANHMVIENLVRGGGFTPLEAIRIATLDGAIFLKVQDRVGSIAVGKQADLLVVRGDPSIAIEDIQNVDIVFKEGIGYDPVTLLAAVKGTVGWR